MVNSRQSSISRQAQCKNRHLPALALRNDCPFVVFRNAVPNDHQIEPWLAALLHGFTELVDGGNTMPCTRQYQLPSHQEIAIIGD